MDRNQLEALAASRDYVVKITRDDIASIVALLDAADARAARGISALADRAIEDRAATKALGSAKYVRHLAEELFEAASAMTETLEARSEARS